MAYRELTFEEAKMLWECSNEQLERRWLDHDRVLGWQLVTEAWGTHVNGRDFYFPGEVEFRIEVPDDEDVP